MPRVGFGKDSEPGPGIKIRDIESKSSGVNILGGLQYVFTLFYFYSFLEGFRNLN